MDRRSSPTIIHHGQEGGSSRRVSFTTVLCTIHPFVSTSPVPHSLGLPVPHCPTLSPSDTHPPVFHFLTTSLAPCYLFPNPLYHGPWKIRRAFLTHDPEMNNTPEKNSLLSVFVTIMTGYPSTSPTHAHPHPETFFVYPASPYCGQQTCVLHLTIIVTLSSLPLPPPQMGSLIR